MSEETKAAHISGRYLLLSVILTAGCTLLLSLPIGSHIGETKGTAEVDKMTQEHDAEVASITGKYNELQTAHQELQEQFDALTINYDNSQQQCAALEDKCNSLSAEYDALQNDYNVLSERYDALDQQYRQLGDTNQAPESTNPPDPNTVEFLSNFTPVSGTTNSNQYRIWDVSMQDNYGNKYSAGIGMRQEYSKKFHMVYALDAKYKKLTGKFVLAEDSKNTDGHYTLSAYSLVDGNMQLLGSSKVLATATRPIDVEFDVEGVMDLVIEVYDPKKSSNNAWTAFVDAKLE